MPDTRETLEAMAKAIEALGPLDLANYQHQRMVARAAFLAFAKCEPSEKMKEAGMETAPTTLFKGTGWRMSLNTDQCGAIFTAMLAQAVKEIGDE